ncbi:MAG: SLC13 family permease [Balneolaceae bacterium]|nr:MAG: SLC13 family permease [Balneolaceae bacterium]
MDHIIVFITLGAALILFIWGRWRHDVVALLALLFLVIWGIVPSDKAFTGFAHPAVITVAAVLLIGRGLELSGLVDLLARTMKKAGKNLYVQISVLSLITALASAFMNNVGALAILMPVAIHVARKNGHPPSAILMPIAFASLLGGMITLIGTPPNIIIATFRADYYEEAFGMFDFAPVGLPLTIIGILFIALLGWKLLPKRKGQTSDSDLFEIDSYITEVRVTKDSKIRGKTCGEINTITEEEVMLLGLVRQKKRIHTPSKDEPLKTNDILILETDADGLKTFIDKTGVKLVGNRKFRKDAEGSDEIVLREVVVMPDSPLIGNTAVTLNMRTRYGINLLAIARHDRKIRKRMDHVRFANGDVLLLQGRSVTIDDVITSLRCLPLVARDLTIGKPRKVVFALAIFLIAIATVIFGMLPVQIAFAAGAVAMVLTGLLPLRDIYQHIDWPVIVLLGAMIPVGVAFETTGGADLLAGQILILGDSYPVWFMVGLVMVITMFLSDLINNAATIVLMAPIGITIAGAMGISADPMLMAIAVGGSSAFLTPIGHQSNTLVMGPGGYKFSDYWRMGLPLEIIIVLIGTPLILFFWPA